MTLGLTQDETLTFVDPLGSVTWLKHDAAGNPARRRDLPTRRRNRRRRPGRRGRALPETVVDNGTNDTDPAAGVIKVVNVPIGTYTVTETAAPTGYVLDATPKKFTITQRLRTPRSRARS